MLESNSFDRNLLNQLSLNTQLIQKKKVLILPEVDANYVIKNKDQTVLNESYQLFRSQGDSNKSSCKSASLCCNHDEAPSISYCINAVR